MVDLMLVNPLFLCADPVEQRLMTPYFPLGLLYLAGSTRAAGYDVSIFDAMFKSGEKEFVAALQREQPRVVGISVLATVRAAALRLAELAHHHGAMVVVGGADPTGRPESYLQYGVKAVAPDLPSGSVPTGNPPVDVVVVGEGEQTLLELLPLLLNADSIPDTSTPRLPGREIDRARLRQVPGLAFLDTAGGTVSTAARTHCTDLDRLSLPARDMLDVEAYRRAWQAKHGTFSLSIIASRGCPYGCTWCQKSVFGRSFRSRSAELVAQEMRTLKDQYHPDMIRIVDDVVGIDRRWVQTWHDAVLSLDAVVPFECLSRVDLLDEELVRLLQEAGCRRIALGAESGSQRVLDAMRKGTTVEQIRAAADLCHRCGIETYFYIMIGYPGENWHDIRATVSMLKETRPTSFSSTIAYPLPGTDFYEEVKHRLLDAPDWDYTAQNRLLFERDHPTQFYNWVQRWMYHEWWTACMASPDQPVQFSHRLWHRLSLWSSRGMVGLLRHVPTRGPTVRSGTTGNGAAL